MKNILILSIILAIILAIIISVSALGLLSLSEPEPEPEPEPELTMEERVANFQRTALYVRENVNHIIPDREYSAVMSLANSDPDRAIEIFNDPEYPDKFYDETGHFP